MFVKSEQKKMVNERVYPISDYYTSIVKFPIPNQNEPKKPMHKLNPSPILTNKQSSNFSPSSITSNFSPASTMQTPSPVSNNDINLLMTPGLLRNNLNDSWMSNPKTPSRDYEPLPPDLGSFNNFN